MTLGVTVITGARPGASGSAPVNGGSYFTAGITERGSISAAGVVTSMADYVNSYGNRVTYGFLYDNLTQFFNEGGQQAFVARVVGPGSTTGLLTLVDGSAVNTLTMTAANPGSWSSNLTVEVTVGSFLNTFNIILRLSTTVVEQYLNLATPAAAAAAMAVSTYVVVTNLGSVTAAPGNNPAVVGPTGVGAALSAGNDDRVDVTANSYIAAVNALFTPSLGTGAVSIPGQNASVIGQSLLVHCSATDRLALMAPPSGSSLAQAQSVAVSVKSSPGVEFGGVFWPWVLVPDGFGGALTIPPEGYIAGVRARIISAFGTWRASFGDAAVTNWAVSTELPNLSSTDANSAYNSLVNPIRVINGSVENYGWRSLSVDPNYHFLTGRDTLNFVAAAADAVLEAFVGETIDARGALFSKITIALTGILEPMRLAGGLYPLLDGNGNQIDAGYSIDTGSDINSPTSIGAGQINAAIAIRISPSAEMIQLTISKVGFTGSL